MDRDISGPLKKSKTPGHGEFPLNNLKKAQYGIRAYIEFVELIQFIVYLFR